MAARKREYIRWGVTGECGLYTGQMLTRADAIAGHTHLARRRDEPEVSRFAFSGGKLSADQRQIWERCKKRGDRVVKLKVTLLTDPQ